MRTPPCGGLRLLWFGGVWRGSPLRIRRLVGRPTPTTGAHPGPVGTEASMPGKGDAAVGPEERRPWIGVGWGPGEQPGEDAPAGVGFGVEPDVERCGDIGGVDEQLVCGHRREARRVGHPRRGARPRRGLVRRRSCVRGARRARRWWRPGPRGWRRHWLKAARTRSWVPDSEPMTSGSLCRDRQLRHARVRWTRPSSLSHPLEPTRQISGSLRFPAACRHRAGPETVGSPPVPLAPSPPVR